MSLETCQTCHATSHRLREVEDGKEVKRVCENCFPKFKSAKAKKPSTARAAVERIKKAITGK